MNPSPPQPTSVLLPSTRVEPIAIPGNCLPRRLLWEHADSDLPPAMQRAVEDHIARCTDCARESAKCLATTRRLRRLGGALPSVVPGGLVAATMRRVALGVAGSSP